jgi:hypothetical protein
MADSMNEFGTCGAIPGATRVEDNEPPGRQGRQGTGIEMIPELSRGGALYVHREYLLNH